MKNAQIGNKSTQNKQIVFCIDSLTKGGAERVVATLSNELDKKYTVSIITMTNREISYELSPNINIYKLSAWTDKKIFAFISIPLAIFKLKKILNQIRPDITIGFLRNASIMMLLANRQNFNTIVSVRNDPTKKYTNFPYNYLMNKLFPNVNGFVFQTSDAESFFNKILQKSKAKHSIILNPINPIFIKQGKKKIKEKNIIISVGRLSKQKNHMSLIKAFNMLPKKYSNLKLIIYGEGPERKKIENYIERHNLKKKVLLPGRTDDIKDKLLESKLFVMSSNYEGMPNALIEAMVLGKPVISTDCPCGGPKTLITNNVNGWLVPVDDPLKLAESIKNALDNNKDRHKVSKNAQSIIDRVHPDKITSQWESFIESIIGEKSND